MNEQILEDRLTEEAARHSPAFSPSLHRRIMQRISIAPTAELRPIRLNWLRPLSIAAAAVLVIGAFLLARYPQPSKPRRINTVAIRNVPSVPVVSDPVDALDVPIVTELTTARYAYLDRDGEKMLGYVGRQLDFMPK